MKKILLFATITMLSSSLAPMAAAMEKAAQEAKTTTTTVKPVEPTTIHSIADKKEPDLSIVHHEKSPTIHNLSDKTKNHENDMHTTMTGVNHIAMPIKHDPHEASMHKAMTDSHHATMPKMPKIAPIPPMPSKIKTTSHTPGMMHSMSHTQHMEDGHSKIQVAIDSMQQGVSSMNDAIGNLKDVQTSIVKIKSAISELLNTHLN